MPDSPIPLLFQPITLRGVTARNRIVVSPMCQYASQDGGRKGSVCEPWEGYRSLTPADAARGRVAWQTVSASALAANAQAATPRELDRDEIRAMVACWREAALRTLDADYDIIEVHAAHSYLIHQFLSPLANRRTDAYGGDSTRHT